MGWVGHHTLVHHAPTFEHLRALVHLRQFNSHLVVYMCGCGCVNLSCTCFLTLTKQAACVWVYELAVYMCLIVCARVVVLVCYLHLLLATWVGARTCMRVCVCVNVEFSGSRRAPDLLQRPSRASRGSPHLHLHLYTRTHTHQARHSLRK